MPEQAVVEAPAVEQAATPEVAEPTIAETPAAPSPVEGEANPVVEETPLDLKELLKGAKASELRAVLESVPDDVRAEVEAELEKRVEQRVRTREQEVTQAVDARTQLWTQTGEVGRQAEDFLRDAVRRFNAGDPEALAHEATPAAIDAYANGKIASLALANEQALKPVRDEYLPEPTEAEVKALDKVLYDDARRGTLSQIPVLMKLVSDRARAEGKAEGLAEGTQRLEASDSLIEKIKGIELAKNQPVSIEGAAPAAVMSRQAFEALTLDEQEKVPPADRARIYQESYRGS